MEADRRLARHISFLRPVRQRRDEHHSAAGVRLWEHAYHLQYRNVRPDYVQKLWSLVNWTDVTARLDTARAK